VDGSAIAAEDPLKLRSQPFCRSRICNSHFVTRLRWCVTIELSARDRELGPRRSELSFATLPVKPTL